MIPGRRPPLLVVLLVLVFAPGVNARAVEVIAHRGGAHDAPENTLAAFRHGFASAADGCELDFHLTRDGRLVVLHDYDTKRVAGDRLVVADATYAELERLDIGQWGPWHGSKYHARIPTLAEAIALVPAGRRFFLEIKCPSEPAAERRMIEQALPEAERVVAAAHCAPEQLPFIAFSRACAAAAKQRFPHHDVYWLVSWHRDHATGEYPAISDLIRLARESRLDGLDLDARFPIDAALVAQVHDAGLKLYTWTVDDPVQARALAAAGVDGITTNQPAEIGAAVAR